MNQSGEGKREWRKKRKSYCHKKRFPINLTHLTGLTFIHQTDRRPMKTYEKKNPEHITRKPSTSKRKQTKKIIQTFNTNKPETISRQNRLYFKLKKKKTELIFEKARHQRKRQND